MGQSCYRKRDDPEPTQGSPEDSGVLSQSACSGTKGFLLPLSDKLFCLASLLSGWKRPWTAISISWGSYERLWREELILESSWNNCTGLIFSLQRDEGIYEIYQAPFGLHAVLKSRIYGKASQFSPGFSVSSSRSHSPPISKSQLLFEKW